MNESHPFKDSARPIVYVREVSRDELPAELQPHLPNVPQLYAIHHEEGERMAVVADRTMAFVVARQHDYDPVSVH